MPSYRQEKFEGNRYSEKGYSTDGAIRRFRHYEFLLERVQRIQFVRRSRAGIWEEQCVERERSEVRVKFNSRVILSHFAANKQAMMLDSVVKQYETRFGEING